MAIRNSKKMVTIPLDFSKTVGNPNEEAVLLFDEASNCYYRVSLSHVIGAAVSAVSARVAELERQLAEEKAKNAEFRENLDKEQKDFIADMRETNSIIISLVEGGKK